jgi:WD40 repeat protein/serine/threonine protein kinase/class 3 adenylate cyclase
MNADTQQAGEMPTDSGLHLTPEQRQAVEEFRQSHRTGVLALLFTDVVGSTEIKQQLGDAAGVEFIRRHRSLIRDILGSFNEAQEVSTAGDSFFIVFVKPSDAVRFALRVQNALRSVSKEARAALRVRIGIHLGEVFIEEEPEGSLRRDVLGMQVDTASRAMSLGVGGQVLMTRSVFDNARTILRGEALAGLAALSWLSHGFYTVKGIEEPIEICEVGEEGSAPLQPPADSEKARRYVTPAAEPVLGWRPAIEQTIPGTEWQLEEKLGEGGFGEVWLARHRRTKELRVFKFCFRADRLRSLKREMTLFRILKEVLGERPDIARLYEVQFDQAPYYLVLEYTPGGNLADWLARKQVGRPDTQVGRPDTPVGQDVRDTLLGQVGRPDTPVGQVVRDALIGRPDTLVGQVVRDTLVGRPDTLVGQDVRDRSVPPTEVPLSVRLEIVAQIATALAAAHSVGVIHKDIKPSNILIEERKDGAPAAPPVSSRVGAPEAGRCPSVQVRLTDFGIGQLMDREALERAGITAAGFTETAGAMTELSSRTGTRIYMAPELLAGRPPSIQSDIYSLGVLLYQMIVADLSQPMTTDWERRIPDPLLRDDLRRCLAGDPAERFASASDLAENLRSHRQRRLRLRAKRLTQAAFAALLTVVVIAGAVTWLWSYRARQAEREMYYGNISLAERCIEGLQYDRARELLAACPEDLRNWEWGRLEWLCNLDLITLEGYIISESGYWVAFSPDGKRLAAASYRTAMVWDYETGRELLTLKGHATSVYSFAFSPDGKRLATGSSDETAKVWDSETGRELLTLKGHAGTVSSIAFGPDGKRLATGSDDGTAKVWDSETGRELLTLKGHTDRVLSVAFSPDGKRLATASGDNTAKIWDSETGRELLTLKGHTGIVFSVAFSPDGKRLATASADKTAKVWDSETGRELLTLKGHDSYVRSVAFSPGGKRLATASEDRTAKVWDSETGRELLTLKGHGKGVNSVAFSPDGKRLTTTSRDRTVKVWDSEGGHELLTLKGHDQALLSLAFSPDGKRLATGSSDNTAKIWDAETGRELLTLKGHAGDVFYVAFSPGGMRLATGSSDETAKIWDAETGRELLTLKVYAGAVGSVAFSPGGKRLATGSSDETAKIWDAETGRELLTLKGHDGGVNSVAFSPDGKRLATGSSDNTAKIWDAETGRELLTLKGHDGDVYSVAFSPDDKRLATASDDKTAKVWDSETGRELVTLKVYAGDVGSVAFSPDGKRLATGSDDGTAKIWDAETGRELLTLKGHTSYVTSVAFSRDGERLATGSSDNTAKIWDSLPWRDEDLPGDASMSYEERVALYKLNRWEEKAPTPTTATVPADVIKADEQIRSGMIAAAETRRKKMEEELAPCAGRLRQIHAALLRYRADHRDQLPNWLSDLAPRYLTSDTLLCPADRKGWSPYNRDANTSCSYGYEFNPRPMARWYHAKYGKTTREWKEKQLKELGDIVPVVRCMHHSEMPQYERVLSLSYGGKLYLSPLVWEKGPREDFPTTQTTASNRPQR